MADIELIIKIPEKVYNALTHTEFDANLVVNEMRKSIANGIPLPKGHGRLIDADAFERRCMFDSNIEDMQDVIYALRDFKPVIEADKERSE